MRIQATLMRLKAYSVDPGIYYRRKKAHSGDQGIFSTADSKLTNAGTPTPSRDRRPLRCHSQPRNPGQLLGMRHLRIAYGVLSPRDEDQIARLLLIERRLLIRPKRLDRGETGFAKDTLDLRSSPSADLHTPGGEQLDGRLAVGALAEGRRHEDDAAVGLEVHRTQEDDGGLFVVRIGEKGQR